MLRANKPFGITLILLGKVTSVNLLVENAPSSILTIVSGMISFCSLLPLKHCCFKVVKVLGNSTVVRLLYWNALSSISPKISVTQLYLSH